MPVTPTKGHPLLSNLGNETPPATPPNLSRSVYSDADSVSLRDSWNSPVANVMVPRKLTYGDMEPLSVPVPTSPKMFLKEKVPTPEALLPGQRGAEDTPIAGRSLEDLAAFVPDACPIQAEPDIPGYIPPQRRGSAFSSDSSDGGEGGEDDDSVRDFSLEDFPVPSAVLSSPRPPSQPGRASGETVRSVGANDSSNMPTVSEDDEDDATPQLAQAGTFAASQASSVGQPPRKLANGSSNSPHTMQTGQSTPRPDLFTLRSGTPAQADWDLAEEVGEAHLHSAGIGLSFDC